MDGAAARAGRAAREGRGAAAPAAGARAVAVGSLGGPAGNSARSSARKLSDRRLRAATSRGIQLPKVREIIPLLTRKIRPLLSSEP
ncbi:hypothetical protein SCE1572_04815 [Sorangium cellulosum So0157-2]|uniref:Uncharacterized protein n=1 Tax=Sorangium cellulosum So0157-2 TaxID=1254432 RepID=S4XMR4_SORCE|nr:hypothetical protein SCE1572_04815 [Sorangium cellulosum So0157-2]